jgi:hypothetical protein
MDLHREARRTVRSQQPPEQPPALKRPPLRTSPLTFPG